MTLVLIFVGLLSYSIVQAEARILMGETLNINQQIRDIKYYENHFLFVWTNTSGSGQKVYSNYFINTQNQQDLYRTLANDEFVDSFHACTFGNSSYVRVNFTTMEIQLMIIGEGIVSSITQNTTMASMGEDYKTFYYVKVLFTLPIKYYIEKVFTSTVIQSALLPMQPRTLKYVEGFMVVEMWVSGWYMLQFYDTSLLLVKQYSQQSQHAVCFYVTTEHTLITTDNQFYLYSNSNQSLLYTETVGKNITECTIMGENIILFTEDSQMYQYNYNLMMEMDNMITNYSGIIPYANGLFAFVENTTFLYQLLIDNFIPDNGTDGCGEGYMVMDGNCVEEWPDVKAAMRVTGSVLIVASWKVSTKFLIPFVGILEDLSYYKYHNATYPPIMQYFLNNTEILNIMRLKPPFLEVHSLGINVLNDTKYNQMYLQYQEETQGLEQVEQVYFLHATKEIYILNFAMNAVYFIIILLLRQLFFYLRSKFTCKAIRVMSADLRNRSRWWIFLIMILDSNLLRISFHVFRQMVQPYSFNFENKVNLVIAVMVGFVVMIFSIGSYLLIYRYCRQKVSEILLSFSDFALGSFILEIMIILMRNSIRGFIHSYFIANYPVQILSLIAFDFALLLLFPIFKQHCHNCLTFLTYFLYAFVFLIFDIALYLKHLNVMPISISDELISILILIIIGLTIIKILLAIYQILKQIKKLCISTQVKPINKKQNQSSIKQQNLKKEILNQKLKQSKEEKIKFQIEVESVQGEMKKENQPQKIQHSPMKVVLYEIEENKVQILTVTPEMREEKSKLKQNKPKKLFKRPKKKQKKKNQIDVKKQQS